jgi:hypothetical protein
MSLSKKVIFLDHKDLKQGSLELVKLKHPKAGELLPFLVSVNSEGNVNFHEIVSFYQELGSVFIDDYVQSENSIFLSSRFNLNYFLLSFVSSLTKFEFDSIEAFKSKFIDFLTDAKDMLTKHPDCLFAKLEVSVSNLSKLFDVKETGKRIEVRVNTSKVVEWLKSKVELLKVNLEKDGENSSRVQAKAKQQPVEESNAAKYRLEAFELLAQYVEKGLAESLRKDLHLASPLESSSENKRQKQTVTVD